MPASWLEILEYLLVFHPKPVRWKEIFKQFGEGGAWQLRYLRLRGLIKKLGKPRDRSGYVLTDSAFKLLERLGSDHFTFGNKLAEKKERELGRKLWRP